MKKIGAIVLAGLLSCGVSSYPTLAQEEAAQVINVEEENTTNYMRFSGVIKEIDTEEKEIRLTVENADEIIMILRINDDSLLFNSGTTSEMLKTEFKKGATVEAYYDKNKPMILIYPAQVTPEIVILRNEAIFGEVKISKFNDEFLSLDDELKVNIGEETILLNQHGEKIEEEDLQGKELAVFYTWTTKSIPAQTTPSKIITLDYVMEEMARVQEIIADDHYMKNGVKMIPLRKVAEQLNYDVLAQAKISGALLTKGTLSFTIKRGDKIYGFNRSIGKLEVAPELRDKKTYVPVDFLELLIRK